MRGRSTWPLYLFAFILLFFGCGIRSGVVVDTSFLPRFLILSLLLLVTWLIIYRRRPLPPPGFVELALVLFYIWNLLSSIWAIVPSEALVQSQLVFLALATFLVISALTEYYPGFESIFIRNLLVLALFSFGLTLWKMVTLEDYDPYQLISISGHKNLFAGFLLLVTGFSLRGYSLFRGFWKYLAVAVTTGSLFFIVVLQSRAGYLGISFAVISLLLILSIRYRSLITKRNVRMTLLTLGMVTAGLVIFYLSLNHFHRQYFLSKLPVGNYFVTFDEEKMESSGQESPEGSDRAGTPLFDMAGSYYEKDNVRIIFWKKSVPLFLANPFCGVGAGNWKLAVPSVPLPENPHHTIRGHTYSQPHNEIISMATELGIVGFILALIVFAVPPGIILYRIIRNTGKPPPGSLFYFAFIGGFYLYCLFDFPLKRVEHNVLLFSAMAFIFRLSPVNILRLPAPGPAPKTLLYLLVPVILLWTICLVSFRISGEFYTKKLFRSERKQDAEVVRFCRKAESPFYRLTPNTLPLAWFEGVAFYRMGDYTKAETCFVRALKITPHEVRVLNDYGITLHQLGKEEQALSVLTRCVYLDPHFDDAKFNLAAMYFISGRQDEARRLVLTCRPSKKRETYLLELGPWP